jgi:hypothetical protein
MVGSFNVRPRLAGTMPISSHPQNNSNRLHQTLLDGREPSIVLFTAMALFHVIYHALTKGCMQAQRTNVMLNTTINCMFANIQPKNTARVTDISIWMLLDNPLISLAQVFSQIHRDRHAVRVH